MAASMYQAKKKKREVDPNAPPRPSLLGHEKEMKGWRGQFAELTQRDITQQITIKALERKVARLESRLDVMSSFVNRLMKR